MLLAPARIRFLPPPGPCVFARGKYLTARCPPTFDFSQSWWSENRLYWLMASFVYRCPNTGLRVNGFVADDPTDDAFESMTCTACTRVHLVNPRTGKVLGEDDE